MSNDNQIDNKILVAARSLLADVGDTFTMGQLEARAGVSRTTIYSRMGNKEVLLERLARERGESFKRTDVRLDILQAARVVFSRKGLVAATMEQIANEAHVGVATVYRHFGDKENLLRAFIEEMTPRTAVRTVTLNPTEDVVADLDKIVGATLIFFFENRDILRLVFMGSETERRYLESLRAHSDSTLGRLTDYFRAQMAAGRIRMAGEPKELALALIGMVLAFAVIGPLQYGTTINHPEESGQLIVRLFLGNLVSSQSLRDKSGSNEGV